MALTPLPNARQQFLDGNGNPLAGGLVYTYVPFTTTFATTYQDLAGTIPNSNPIVLDSSGECFIYGSGQIRELVKDSLQNVIWDGVTSGVTTGSADNITWQGPYPENIQETVTEKLDQLLSVIDFGATTDGADCSAAVTASLNRVGYAYFPNGNYVINSPVFSASNSRIYGQSKNAVISTALSAGVFILLNANNVSISSLTFIGTAGSANAVYCTTSTIYLQDLILQGISVVLDQCSQPILQNILMGDSATQSAGRLYLYDSRTNGAGSANGVVENLVWASSATGTGGSVFFIQGSVGWTFSNIVIFMPNRLADGFDILGPCDSLNFSNIYIGGGQSGIFISGTNGTPSSSVRAPSGINITNGNFINQNTYALAVVGYPDGVGGVNAPQKVNITGGQFGLKVGGSSDPTRIGVLIQQSSQVGVRGAQFYSLGTGTNMPQGVVLSNGSSLTAVQSNSFASLGYAIIISTGTTTMLVTDNRIWSCQNSITAPPGGAWPPTDSRYTTPYGNYISGNLAGNPPTGFTQPAQLTGGVPVKNDTGYDCRVVFNYVGSVGGSGPTNTITINGYSFQPVSEMVVDVKVGDTIEIQNTTGAGQSHAVETTWIPA